MFLAFFAAHAGTGIPLEIRVTDRDGSPVPTATVHSSLEREPQRVNTENATWTGDRAFPDDGTEVLFEKKAALEFSIAAPGFERVDVVYVMRKKKNTLVVELSPLPIPPDDPGKPTGIGFGRDELLDK